jgi:hypothetical protein
MHVGSIALFLVACAGPVLAQDAGASFAPELPEGVGDVTGWEIVTGEFETKTARGEYRFYVNPARAAMYQLMRYRVELLDATGAPAGGRSSAERVAFVRRPGTRELIACWEKQVPGLTPTWRRVDAGTEAYRLEMSVLMNVIAVHRAVRASEGSR